jgi:hypothetical protein
LLLVVGLEVQILVAVVEQVGIERVLVWQLFLVNHIQFVLVVVALV